MYGKKVKFRALFIFLILISLVLTIFLVVKSLEENVVYFKSPTDIKNLNEIKNAQKIRVGGMVKKNTLQISNQEIKFIITDFKNEIRVSFKGTVPNLFAEGKGVVAEGKLQDKKFFVAERILAKHDENYMPPEIKNLMRENAK